MRIELNLKVVDELRSAIEAASAGNGDRGAEIGGLLLGRRGDPVRIDAFQIIESGHRRGPSYTLGPKEKKTFSRRMEKTRGFEAVGYFRSHTRTGLYLDQEDFAVMQTFFPDPAQVALVVKPWAGHGQIAGFFFWEDGDIYRRATYQQFPFDPAELQPEQAPTVDAAAAAATVPAPADHQPPPPRMPRPEIAPASRALPGRRAAAAIAAVALGVLALAVGAMALLPRGREEAPPPTSGNDVALSVSRSGGGVRVTWNQDSRTLAAARGATLRIDDGGQERVVQLDERQLRAGSVTYFPASESVTVRLEPGLQVASSAPSEPPPAAEESKPAAKPPAPARNRPKAAPRPFVAGALTRHSDSADRVAFEPPPQITPSLLPPPEPAVIAPEKALPPAIAKVTYEPVQPHALRKVVNKIPGLRLLQKRQYRDAQDFHAARPVRAAPPVIPSGVAAQGSQVGLKILIDKAGEVQRAEVVSRDSNGRLEDMALNSIKDWKFAPARLEEEPVESEMIVHFDFDPVASQPRASSR